MRLAPALLLSALASDPGVTATLVGENLVEEGIPAPQIATFSGRGPLTGAVDILAPTLLPTTDLARGSTRGPPVPDPVALRTPPRVSSAGSGFFPAL